MAQAQEDGVVIKGPKGSEATDVRVGTKRYGPITSDDTLWSIAREHRPHSSVSVNQMMAAIVEANPQAFVNGNMNRMLDGFYLRIPSLQEMQMVNPTAAARQQQLDAALVNKTEDLQREQQRIEEARQTQQQLLTEAKSKAEQTIAEVRAEQQDDFTVLRQQVAESMAAVENVYNENTQLQDRLEQLSERVEALQAHLAEDGELQVQLQQILNQNEQILSEQRQREQQQEGTDWVSWLSQPLNLALLSLLPAIAVLVALYAIFVRRRSDKHEPDEQRPKRAKKSFLMLKRQRNLKLSY